MAFMRNIGLACDTQSSVRHQSRGCVVDEYGRFTMRAVRFSADDAVVSNDVVPAFRTFKCDVGHDRCP